MHKLYPYDYFRQLSKCTDKSALAIHLGEILNETSKFVSNNDFANEPEEPGYCASDSNGNTLKESNRVENHRVASREPHERKTSPIFSKSRAEIASPMTTKSQTHLGTKSTSLLSVINLDFLNVINFVVIENA